ncbi:uncharacterized protein BT62DRAFT_1011993 [Guyanagaster necrorhizus]|uniref:Uncharacterized protein n=1 Tax=Guyanagaster necrorhizus TaxID=856835 RepID=A0A9P7VJP1_9AGAR|nr:uncharacterized protein BT62DRAFT_1011993 [Guyanagaster necrorhizus MCA 3950]KAG7441179.1 hypothetical protein BT62DRAFT_1011993 [Guyanagaster necrorhizus MCA 3950]
MQSWEAHPVRSQDNADTMNPKVIVDDIAHRHAWASFEDQSYDLIMEHTCRTCMSKRGRKGTTTSKSTLLAGCLPPCVILRFLYDIVFVSILRQRIEFDIDADTNSIRPKGLHPYQEALIPRKLHPCNAILSDEILSEPGNLNHARSDRDLRYPWEDAQTQNSKSI